MNIDRLSIQIRSSAVAALRPALHCVLVTLLMIPVTAGVNGIFRGAAQTDWKLSMMVGSVLGLGWFVATFLSTLADLRKEDGIRATKMPSFPAQSFVSGLYGLGVVGSAWIIVGLHREREPLWLQILPLGFVALAFYGWPRTIVCGEQEVSQRSLFGWKRRIPYACVEAISVDFDGSITILGADKTIEHTAQHMDPVRFRAVISERSGKPIYGLQSARRSQPNFR